MISLYGFDPLYLLTTTATTVWNESSTDSMIFKITKKVMISLKENKTNPRMKHKYDMCSSNEIHYGIVPRFKKNLFYKQLFFEGREGFFGLSVNVFQDANISERQRHIVMLSIRSWNHRSREYLDVKKDRYKYILRRLNKTVDTYRINRNGRKIVLFIQNYSESEYWFGWSEGDIDTWVKREKTYLQTIRQYSDRTILLKFHPKTDDRHITYFLESLREQQLNNVVVLPKTQRLDSLLYDVDLYCCIVNSGSVALETCIRGVPLFCIDDTFSNLPIKPFGCKVGIENIENFQLKDLPNQSDMLDFVCSQCFDVDEEMDGLIMCIQNRMK